MPCAQKWNDSVQYFFYLLRKHLTDGGTTGWLARQLYGPKSVDGENEWNSNWRALTYRSVVAPSSPQCIEKLTALHVKLMHLGHTGAVHT